LAIAVMAALRITHPPAGADPLVTAASDAGLDFLLFPMLFGSLALVLAAALHHRVPPRIVYPAKD
jgi:CBS-domain-containing membrane protein